MTTSITASFQYASEDPIEFTIRDGETIAQAWQRTAPLVGADASRGVTFKAGGSLLDGSDTPAPGQVISALVSLEVKGA